MYFTLILASHTLELSGSLRKTLYSESRCSAASPFQLLNVSFNTYLLGFTGLNDIKYLAFFGNRMQSEDCYCIPPVINCSGSYFQYYSTVESCP